MQTKSIDVHNNEIHFNPKAFGQRYTVNGDKKLVLLLSLVQGSVRVL